MELEESESEIFSYFSYLPFPFLSLPFDIIGFFQQDNAGSCDTLLWTIDCWLCALPCVLNIIWELCRAENWRLILYLYTIGIPRGSDVPLPCHKHCFNSLRFTIYECVHSRKKNIKCISLLFKSNVLGQLPV